MGVVSRRWMWVESMGVVVRQYIDIYPHITYPPLLYDSVLLRSIPTFVNKKRFDIIISGRPSFRKCSKCFYVHLNI